MSKDPRRAATLTKTRDQSAQVQDKVQRAGADLSEINAVLNTELSSSATAPAVTVALNEGEAVATAVQQAGRDLKVVSEALTEEILAHQYLERELADRDEALTESRAEERRARYSALHDAVTGLPNATLFADRLDNAVAHAQRHGRHLAVMFIDIDHFKAVNDTHGHAIGDAVLQMVAARLKKTVRTSDTVARRGGDEFVILLLEPRDASNVTALAGRIRDHVAADWTSGDLTLSVTLSVGTAVFPDDAQESAGLLRCADFAMYAMRERSSDNLAEASPDTSESTARPKASAESQA